jgi:tetratricopeptide (TPR) repeat protein
MHLLSAITDCGAGGLSSAVGEMAEGVGTAAAIVVSKRFDEQVYAEGRAGFARTLALKPGDAYALGGDANLVLLAANLGRQKQLYPEALARHEEAAAADPANGTPLVGVGSCLAGLGRWDEAAATYERALELSPRYVLAWDNLALAYDRLGRSADAAEAKARADSLRKASR